MNKVGPLSKIGKTYTEIVNLVWGLLGSIESQYNFPSILFVGRHY